MFGISYMSPGVLEITIDRKIFHVCAIDKFSQKEPVCDPAQKYKEFMNINSGGRTRVVLVYGYSTLKYLPNDEHVKFIVFDSPQILAKYNIEIFDTDRTAGKEGVWKLYKKTPIELNNKITNTEGGFTYTTDASKFNMRDIIEDVCSDLSKPEGFRLMVAKYVAGMVKNSTWNKKIEMLRKITPTKYAVLSSWLETFSPDSLCIAYMDCSFNAPKRCQLYYEGIKNPKNMTQEVMKKFQAVAVRACQAADADIEDFKYLVKILPPNNEQNSEFIVEMPEYLKVFRKKYPLIKKKASVI